MRSLAVTNEGWQFDELASAVMASAECPEVLRMRGYTLHGTRGAHHHHRAGHAEIDGGELRSAAAFRTRRPRAAPQRRTRSHARGPRGVDGLLAPTPPPERAAWCALEIRAEVGAATLVLPEPSVATVDIRPSSSGLVLRCSPRAALGRPRCRRCAAAGGRRAGGGEATPPGGGGAGGAPVELSVQGSGVYMMKLNTNLSHGRLLGARRFEPLRRGSATRWARAAGRRPTPFVGQEDELALEAALRSLWEHGRRAAATPRCATCCAGRRELQQALAAPLSAPSPAQPRHQ